MAFLIMTLFCVGRGLTSYYIINYIDKFGQGIDYLKIFVGAVNETNIIFFGSKLFKILLLLPAVIPDKAEISADYQHIALLKLFEGWVVESADIAVHISGNIYHNSVFPP